MSSSTVRWKLVKPNEKMVGIYNDFWTSNPPPKVRLFANMEPVNVSVFLDEKDILLFSSFEEKDRQICDEEDLSAFLKAINKTYHTRVMGITKIVDELNEIGIRTKSDLRNKIDDGLSVPEFTKICGDATGSYTYSFATKVFSFADEKYPIVDSIVATMLNIYKIEYDYGGTPMSVWGDYALYVKNYDSFKDAFGLGGLSNKQIDKFLWTYGKILEAYWIHMGVFRFTSVPFNPKSLIAHEEWEDRTNE